MSHLVIGCGYLGLRVAKCWAAEGRTVYAVAPSARQAAALERQGLRPLEADVTRPETLGRLPVAETVLYAVGFDRRGGASRRELHVDGLRSVLDRLPPKTGRILYTSSTGVYGQTDGQWVDEESPCQPLREAGQAMLAAEQLLRAHPLGDRAVILRLAGLYGPGRIPKLADLLAGRPVTSPSEGYLNLIHVDDAVRAVLAAEVHARVPRIYLVGDGHPVPFREFYRRLADLLGTAPPEFLEPSATTRTARRGGGNKRVCNSRLLKELKVALKYPTCHAGLAAIVAGLG